jgi:hypothetical protein
MAVDTTGIDGRAPVTEWETLPVFEKHLDMCQVC